ncbi:DDRGK domain-containing protein 1 [Zootermopsis nevadensis]|uniref:DDRGK domain-containing protein 1 n=1 Tax=Zootermopsis nevadensis TaxID=136037 RepID=A0A067R8N1_ZOONE|nr:DDRGK domain-containing protein 1 [Zootermopsis nevadensis]KDR15944.1 DDRGK domain-containing protein 1 [Zootermopsis nevadensis]
MDLIFLISIASGLIVIIFVVALLKQRVIQETSPTRDIPQERAHDRQIPRRAVGARNTRAQLRAAAHQQNEADDEDGTVQDVGEDIEFPDGKIGAKKRAKLEAKAERKAQREAEERSREERKKRQEQAEEERLKAAEREKQEEQERLEGERKAREEKERQEHEEYLKMKTAFSVEEEGYEDDGEDDEQKNLLQEFINHIKNMKVVVLEDLAAHFKLKTQHVINTIQELQAEGLLTGVVDDRGKFIYISTEELEAVAKFIKQRGRVSIVELAESSNQLINLNSNISKSVLLQN